MNQEDHLLADVVVCGCGSSGLIAGLATRYGGASVIMFEKRSAPGGTSLFAEGMFAVESGMQLRNNISVTKEKTIVESGQWRN